MGVPPPASSLSLVPASWPYALLPAASIPGSVETLAWEWGGGGRIRASGCSLEFGLSWVPFPGPGLASNTNGGGEWEPAF